MELYTTLCGVFCTGKEMTMYYGRSNCPQVQMFIWDHNIQWDPR